MIIQRNYNAVCLILAQDVVVAPVSHLAPELDYLGTWNAGSPHRQRCLG
jgi:hypothetical protein